MEFWDPVPSFGKNPLLLLLLLLYTNLMSHLKNVHEDSWEDEYRKSKTKEQAVLL